MSSLARYVLNNPDSVKKMSKDLRRLVKKSCTEVVNATAFEARKNLAARVEDEFFIRNKFLTSQKSLFVTKAPFGHTESLKDIKASVGFSEAASFMQRQDEGGEHRNPSGKNLSIPTDKARKGEARMGVVKTKYYLSELSELKVRGAFTQKYKLPGGGIWNASRKGTGVRGMPKAAGVARAAVAAREGKLIHYKKNLYAISNFVARGGNVSFKRHRIYTFDQTSTKTPARNFIKPECEKAGKGIQERFNAAMDKN
jgi:hypothetical protein